jgi:phosphopantothenate-cysteine ligase
MSKHKIQSSQNKEGLDLRLKPVPKLITNLRHEWCPNAFIITFKLETDQNLLFDKCKQALEKYQHQLVIGNILETRAKHVIFVQPSTNSYSMQDVLLNNQSDEIEKQIVENLKHLHLKFLNQKN